MQGLVATARFSVGRRQKSSGIVRDCQGLSGIVRDRPDSPTFSGKSGLPPWAAASNGIPTISMSKNIDL